MEQSRVGRPRTYQRNEVLDRAVTLFWSQGSVATTTRALEGALGISQSSLYNEFGSKDGLLAEAVAHYEAGLEATVLSKLRPPGRASLVAFIDALVEWVGVDEHRGCLVMNLAAEDRRHGHRMQTYRSTLRDAISASVLTFDEGPDPAARTELILAAVFGLIMAARTGATADELADTAAAIKAHVRA